MSTIKENLDRIKNAKSAIKNAIIQKGIEVTDTERIETYADKILQIKTGGGAEIPEFDPEGPLTIYCFDDWGDSYVKFDNGYQESAIQYSTDGSTWKTYTDETIKLTRGKYVQFKGVITQYAQSNHFSTFILKNGLFNLYGNLTSLDNYISTFDGGYKYIHMFENTNVYDCSKLNTGIKSQTGSNVFEYMFSNCLNLIKAPQLPATTLADYCYNQMFSGCKSLTTIPELPATTLGRYCYDHMFSGCTSLTTIPELPATTLANYCYYQMFKGCSSLTTIPSNLLPATTVAEYCYSNMFYGCSSLTTVPKLPATTLANSCYQRMFYGCTSLTTVPSNLLPATTLADNCYSYMFQSCSSLTTIPNLPATTLAASCYSLMFNNCTGLVETPEGWYLPAQTTATNSCSNMFAYCSKLQKISVSYSGAITSSHWRNFLVGVSSTGTFYYSKNQTKENIKSIVPSGWTLVKSTEW